MFEKVSIKMCAWGKYLHLYQIVLLANCTPHHVATWRGRCTFNIGMRRTLLPCVGCTKSMQRAAQRYPRLGESGSCYCH